MTNAAYKLESTSSAADQRAVALPQFRLIKGNRDSIKKNRFSVLLEIPKEVIVLGAILACIQILDGVLTVIGVANWGTHAEGNLILRELMHLIGYVPALITAKTLAITVIGALCYLSLQVSWIKHALKAVIGIYLVAAILPWSYLLINHL
jgi:hypothetical protein